MFIFSGSPLQTYPVSSGVRGPCLEVAGWSGSAEVGRCRQCLEAGKLSVWTDYEPPALDFESVLSCRTRTEQEKKTGMEISVKSI